MKSKFWLLTVLCVLAVATACEEPLDIDKEEPRITDILVNGVNDILTINAGDTLFFEAGFDDNVSLQKYRIRIKPDFTALIGFVPYEFEEVVPISGSATHISKSVEVPFGTASGLFDIIVEVMDEESNVSSAFEIPLTIQATGMPLVSMSQPSFASDLLAAAGDTIPMTGTITDDEALAQIQILLSQESAAGFQSLYSQTFNYNPLVYTLWSTDTLASDSIPFNIPTSAQPGVYDLQVSAFDTLGNFSAVRTNVEIQ